MPPALVIKLLKLFAFLLLQDAKETEPSSDPERDSSTQSMALLCMSSFIMSCSWVLHFAGADVQLLCVASCFTFAEVAQKRIFTEIKH